MIVAKGNQILVAWTSKNCKGGVPGNQGDGDGPYGGDDDDHDPHNKLSKSDLIVAIVSRSKVARCVTTTQMKFLRSERCHSAACGLHEARSKVMAAINWTKPERLTSGRRDAFQLVAAVAGNKTAWALAWQEDPKGLRVGEACGTWRRNEWCDGQPQD